MGIGDKAKAAADQIAGKVKQGVGDVTDNERLEAEGHVQETQGDARAAGERVKDGAKDVLNDIERKID